MTDSRGVRPDGIAATDDVQMLRDRITELERQLESKPSRTSKSSGGGLKILAGVLAALGVVMALPAFLTLRRWYEWWR